MAKNSSAISFAHRYQRCPSCASLPRSAPRLEVSQGAVRPFRPRHGRTTRANPAATSALAPSCLYPCTIRGRRSQSRTRPLRAGRQPADLHLGTARKNRCPRFSSISSHPGMQALSTSGRFTWSTQPHRPQAVTSPFYCMAMGRLRGRAFRSPQVKHASPKEGTSVQRAMHFRTQRTCRGSGPGFGIGRAKQEIGRVRHEHCSLPVCCSLPCCRSPRCARSR